MTSFMSSSFIVYHDP